jgi:hypothetical protein
LMDLNPALEANAESKIGAAQIKILRLLRWE